MDGKPILAMTEDEFEKFERMMGNLELRKFYERMGAAARSATYTIRKFSLAWLAGITVDYMSTPESRFDNALASARGWRQDALLYQGERRQIRIRHAERMEAIAERILNAA
jgi:hypothetical protein